MQRLRVVVGVFALANLAPNVRAQGTPYGIPPSTPDGPGPYNEYQAPLNRPLPWQRYGQPPYGRPYVEEERRSYADEAVQSMRQQASGSQAGTLVDTGGGELALRPFDSRSGIAHFQLNRDVPATSGGDVFDVGELRPGMRVRVYYQSESFGQRPRVVGVEVLGR
jgi:hypothetical protein